MAVLAGVRPLPRVDLLVHFQAVSSVETFPTLPAAEGARASVETLMVPQQLLESEALPTDLTRVWSHT